MGALVIHLLALLLWIYAVVFAARLAGRKGRSAPAWAIATLLLGWPLLILLALPGRRPRQTLTPRVDPSGPADVNADAAAAFAQRDGF